MTREMDDRAGRQAGIDLPATPLAARRAREFVTERLAGWAVPPDVGRDVVLAASELVTNAVEHGRGAITVQLQQFAGRLRLRVWDASPEPPVPTRAPLLSARNRGLTIVAALGATIGHEPDNGGKWVWADFPHTPAPAGRDRVPER